MYSGCLYKRGAMPPKRRKKVRKDVNIQIRATVEQKKLLAEAATKVGLGLSPWLLTLGLKAAAELKTRETQP